MADGSRDFLRAWEEYRMEAERYRELDGELVLVLDRCRGRGKASGLETGPMRHKGAVLFHISGGEVTRLVVYYDRGRALADLGLAAEGYAADSP